MMYTFVKFLSLSRSVNGKQWETNGTNICISSRPNGHPCMKLNGPDKQANGAIITDKKFITLLTNGTLLRISDIDHCGMGFHGMDGAEHA